MAGTGRGRRPVPPRGGGPGRARQRVTCGRLPPAADTLRRTPLFDRHERAGARLVPFAGWEMPVQYEGIRQEHVAVRTGAGMFDVSHMGEIETSGPQAEELPSAAALERRHEDRRARRPVLGALPRGRRRARRPVHLPARARPLSDDHERGEPREGPRVVPRARGRVRRGGGRRARALGDARRAGPRGARGGRARGRGRAAGADADGRGVDRGRGRASPAAPATPARTAWSC